jgi:metal-sulfur cluster biosynthetic enzyme
MTNFRYADHTDSVQTKLRLIEAAHKAGHLDLAMSLAASIRGTLEFERQVRDPGVAPQVSAAAFTPTADLPPPIARFARGWSFVKPVALSETIGIARSAEPIDVRVAFQADQVNDLAREVRVARWEDGERRLRDVPSQVSGVSRIGGEFHCQVLFFADVAAHDSAHYFILYGNPNAELPDYVTDLAVEGEGYGLDVANVHYRAQLSRQTGQIERITYAREHGLELYAGGKGHGEPPDIDWGHDYVDQGNFQKLRMRNWAEVPNYEVLRGPLAITVRRWGFPHSPIHPLFTPSRMHMDISYTFFAGQPYFLKQGRMDVVQDVAIEAMRDDEWVFSGYSFTDVLWIDASGRLHEGAVPAEQLDNLWGVGFRNRTSGDAFIALRLEHAAIGIEPIPHGGPPTLNYPGHGQLWSRYPAQKTTLPAGATIRQKNAYLVAAYPEQDAAAAIQSVRERLLNPLAVRAEMPAFDGAGAAGAYAAGLPLARTGETPDTASLKRAIWNTLVEVRDEQLYSIDANIVDMGYVYDVRERDGRVRVLVTMPHRGRPIFNFLVTRGGGRVEEGIRERLLKLKGVRDVVVEFSWEPPWTSARLTDKGRAALGLTTA